MSGPIPARQIGAGPTSAPSFGSAGPRDLRPTGPSASDLCACGHPLADHALPFDCQWGRRLPGGSAPSVVYVRGSLPGTGTYTVTADETSAGLSHGQAWHLLTETQAMTAAAADRVLAEAKRNAR